MAFRTRLVVANWKMNKTPREAADWAGELLTLLPDLPAAVELAVAPAFPALERVGRMLQPTRVALAAQDVFTEPKGAFTGEVSAAMLEDLGVTFGIVGHSERRRERIGDRDGVLPEDEASRRQPDLADLLRGGDARRTRLRGDGAGPDPAAGGARSLPGAPGRPGPRVRARLGHRNRALGDAADGEEAHRFLRGLLSERYGTERARPSGSSMAVR